MMIQTGGLNGNGISNYEFMIMNLWWIATKMNFCKFWICNDHEEIHQNLTVDSLECADFNDLKFKQMASNLL